MYKVNITKKHCKDSEYIHIHDCPLFRAVNEQYPELGVTDVGGNTVLGEKYILSIDKGWNQGVMDSILRNKIESYEVILRIKKERDDND